MDAYREGSQLYACVCTNLYVIIKKQPLGEKTGQNYTRIRFEQSCFLIDGPLMGHENCSHACTHKNTFLAFLSRDNFPPYALWLRLKSNFKLRVGGREAANFYVRIWGGPKNLYGRSIGHKGLKYGFLHM